MPPTAQARLRQPPPAPHFSVRAARAHSEQGMPSLSTMKVSDVQDNAPPVAPAVAGGSLQPAARLNGDDSGSSLPNTPRHGTKLAELPGQRSQAVVAPVGGQEVKSQVSKPGKRRVGKSPAPAKKQVGNVVEFPLLTGEQPGQSNALLTGEQGSPKVLLLTGEQKKPKLRKQITSVPLLTGEQSGNLKAILPALEPGFWWETPADDKGFKIKLRWRDELKKQHCHVFRRLGKYELQTLRRGTYAEQCSDLYDRLTGELSSAGKRELAARIKINPENDSRFGAADSAIAG